MAFDLGELLKDVPKLGTDREQIEYIHLDLIEEDPNNFYKLSDIENLAANIALCGLQQPIRVRAVEGSDKYRIVSGHRRRAAVEELRKDDAERWSEVACIIEQDEASPALQQLRLIYANANTRTMTSAEISEQALQVEKLLYQLKEDGYEFPGRMRDHVAQAVGQSKSKLARLKVIREKLSFSWQKSWKDGKLPESTAYELAQLEPYHQDLIFAATDNINYLYAGTVQEYAKRFQAIDEVRCGPRKDTLCTHKVTMLEKSCKDRYSDPCRSRCCMTCASLTSCRSSCAKAEGLKSQKKLEAKAASQAQKDAQAAKDAPVIAKISDLWQRFGLARDLACKEIRDVQPTLGYLLPDDDKVMRLECGEEKISTVTKLPYCHYLNDVGRLIELADLLECSVDFLLCRTDVRETAQDPGNVPDSGTGWQTGNPVDFGHYAAYVSIEGVAEPRLQKLMWDGEEWFMFGNRLEDHVRVLRWIDLPEVSE